MSRFTWCTLFVSWLVSCNAIAAPYQCPAGANWQGEPPPRGDGYFCARPDPDGTLVRHGWNVTFDPLTTYKKEECEYLDGSRHGRCTFYDAEGARSERGYFEAGKRAREWWFWSFTPVSGSTTRVQLTPIDPAFPSRITVRRQNLQGLLVDLGAPDSEAQSLTELTLDYVDNPSAARRITCGATLCVGAGRAPEPLYVKFGPDTTEVERDRDFIVQAFARAQKKIDAENVQVEIAARKAAAEEKRKLKEYKAAVIRYEQLSRQWERTSLRCNDGSRSPSCVCGGGWQGCCSWHGGVDGCPREPPTEPTPPTSSAFESP